MIIRSLYTLLLTILIFQASIFLLPSPSPLPQKNNTPVQESTSDTKEKKQTERSKNKEVAGIKITTLTPSNIPVFNSVSTSIDSTSSNLIRNSSFETESSGQPRGWYYLLDSTTGNTFISPEGIRSGNFGLKFVGTAPGNFGIMQPDLKTVPGRTYTLSAYIKQVNTPSITFRFGLWNEYLNKEGPVKNLSLSTGTKDWTRVSFTTTTPGLITDPKNMFPILEVFGLSSGSVYIDDIQFEEGSSPSVYNSAQAKPSAISGVGDGSIIFSPGGDIYPNYSGLGSLGSSTNKFQSLTLSNAKIDKDGNLTVNGSEIKGTLTLNGNLSLKSGAVITLPSLSGGILRSDSSGSISASSINLANSDVTGTLPVGSGGTGATSLTQYGILYGNGTGAISALTPGTSGYVLQSNGSSTAPSWVVAGSADSIQFSNLTNGTNTSAAMVIGSGASLTYSGGAASSGVINANQLLGNTWASPGSIGITTPTSGSFTTLSASGLITANGSLTIPIGQTLNLPGYDCSAQTNGGALTTTAGGVLTCSADDGGGGNGSSNWRLTNGALSPLNDTLDLLIGNSATSSAKFAFINVAGGTPTASISANSGNNALFLDGLGNIQTTNRQTLILGNSASNANSTGNILLNPNGTGNVGIGTTAPLAKLDVNGNLRVTGFHTDTPTATTSNAGLMSTSDKTKADNIKNLVTDFGADNTGTNDTTATWNNWYSSLPATGGILDVPTGTYRLNSSPTFGTSSTRLPIEIRFAPGATFTGSSNMPAVLSNSAHLIRRKYMLSRPSGGASGQGDATITSEIAPDSTYLGNAVAGYFGAYSPTSGSGYLWATNPILQLNTGFTGNGITEEIDLDTYALDGQGTALLINGVGSKKPGKGLHLTRITSNAPYQTGIQIEYAEQGMTIDGTNAGAGAGTGLNITGYKQNLIKLQPGDDLNPTYALIYGTDSTGGTVKFNLRKDGRGVFSNGIEFGDGTVQTTKGVIGPASSTDRAIAIYNGTGGSTIQNSSIFIDSSGYLGIGTASPGTSLHIARNSSSGVAPLRLENTATDNNTTKTIALDFYGNDTVGGSKQAAQIKVIPGDSNWTSSHLGLFTLTSDYSLQEKVRITSSGNVGIGTTSPLATLDIRGNSATTPIASLSGSTTFAGLVVDNSGSGDLFTASKSGATKFVINNSGNIQFNGGTNFLTTLNSAATATRSITFPDASGTICLQNSSSCGFMTGTNYWQSVNTGTITPYNNTVDLLVGGTSTSSAKFAFLNVNSGTPTASISANSGNNALFIDGLGNIATTNRQTLTLGNSSTYNTTGNILLNPNGTGSVGIGTTAPWSSLSVQKDQDNTSSIDIWNTNNGSSAYAVFNAWNDLSGKGQFGIGSSTTTANVYNNRAFIYTTSTTNGISLVANGSGNDIRFFTGGETASNEKLRIGGSATTPIASLSGSTNFAGLVVDNSGSGDLFTASSSGLPRFTITQSGNVGIGTTSPSQKLEITGNIFLNTTRPEIQLLTSGTAKTRLAQYSAGSVHLTSNLYFDGTNWNRDDISAAGIVYSQGAGINQWRYAAAGANPATLTEYMRIDANGLVGINTVSPLAKLDVRGAGSATLPIASFSGSTTFAGMVVDNSGSGDLFTASSSGLSRFVITQSGSVGIGTTAPLAKLDVNGNLRATSFHADTPTATTSNAGLMSTSDKTKVSRWIDAKADYSINCDGTDETEKFQTLISNLTSGTTVVFPAGTCGYSSELTIGNGTNSSQGTIHNILLLGQGGSYYFSSGTIFKWLGGASSGTMLTLAGNADQLSIKGITFDANNAIANGVTVYSNHYGSLEDIGILNFTNTGLSLLTRVGSLPSHWTNYLTVKGFFIISQNNGITGLLVDGDYAGNADNWQNSFRDGIIQVPNASSGTNYAAHFKFTDSSLFENVELNTYGSGNGYAAWFDGTDNANYPQNLSFLNSSVNSTKVTGTIGKNQFYGFKTRDSETIPTDSNLIGYTDTGQIFNGGINIFQGAVTGKALMTLNETGDQDIFTASAAGATRFVIKNDGLIGIGTSNPTKTLEAVGQYPTIAMTGYTQGVAGFGIFQARAAQGTEAAPTALNSGNTLGFYGFYGYGTNAWAGSATAGVYATAEDNFNNTSMGTNLMLATTPRGSTTRSERLRIVSEGYVGINVSSPSAVLDVRGVGINTFSSTIPVASISGSTTFAAMVVDNSGSGDLFTASKSGATKFTVLNNGNVQINGSVTSCTLGDGSGTTSCSASDIRLKDNITPLSEIKGLDAVRLLNPVSYKWNSFMQSNGATASDQFGFIAQDVASVFPNLVEQDKNTGYYKLDYQGLFAPLVKSIQELDVEVNNSGDLISNLALRVDALEQQAGANASVTLNTGNNLTIEQFNK